MSKYSLTYSFETLAELVAHLNKVGVNESAKATTQPDTAETPKETAKARKAREAAEAAAAAAAAAESDDEPAFGDEEEELPTPTFDEIKALAMKLSKKNPAATAAVRAHFAKHKAVKISDVPEEARPKFYKEMQDIDKANP